MLPDPRQGGRFPYAPNLYSPPAGYYGLLNLYQRATKAIIEWIRHQLPTMPPTGLAEMLQSRSTPWRNCRGHLEAKAISRSRRPRRTTQR